MKNQDSIGKTNNMHITNYGKRKVYKSSTIIVYW